MDKYSPPPVLPALRFDTRNILIRELRNIFRSEHEVIEYRHTLLTDFLRAASAWHLRFGSIAPQQDLATLRFEVEEAKKLAYRTQEAVPDDLHAGTYLDWSGRPRWTDGMLVENPPPKRFADWFLLEHDLDALFDRVLRSQVERMTP